MFVVCGGLDFPAYAPLYIVALGLCAYLSEDTPLSPYPPITIWLIRHQVSGSSGAFRKLAAPSITMNTIVSFQAMSPLAWSCDPAQAHEVARQLKIFIESAVHRYSTALNSSLRLLWMLTR